jgi:hypothetical protein
MKKSTGLLGFISVFVCMLLIVSACHRGNEVQTNPYERLSKADMKYQNIQIVNFTITPRGVQETDNPKGVLEESQQTCAQVLTEARLFNNIRTVNSAEQEGSTMIIQGELTKLRMAGHSEMTIYVKLIDASSGRVISEQQIRENSDPSTGAWSIGATDRALPRTVGSLIADFAINAARK